MSNFAKSAVLLTSCILLGAGLSAATEHPHETDSKTKSSVTAKPDVDFEKDLNTHFEEHAKRLREALTSAKGTKSRIIVREFNSSDDTALAGEKSKYSKRIELIENPDELREAARTIQNMLAESGILESLADVVIDLAEDIELEDTGNGMRLSFNGERLGGFSMDKDNETLSIETMGSNTTIEKDVFIKNGKKRTRIVIETDADDMDFDIVPKTKTSRQGTEF